MIKNRIILVEGKSDGLFINWVMKQKMVLLPDNAILLVAHSESSLFKFTSWRYYLH